LTRVHWALLNRLANRLFFNRIFQNTYNLTLWQPRATPGLSRFDGFDGWGLLAHSCVWIVVHCFDWSIAVLTVFKSSCNTLLSPSIVPLILIVAVPSAVKPRLSVTNVKLWGDPESQPVAEQDGCINFDRKVLSSWSPMSNCGPVSQSIFIKELDRDIRTSLPNCFPTQLVRVMLNCLSR